MFPNTKEFRLLYNFVLSHPQYVSGSILINNVWVAEHTHARTRVDLTDFVIKLPNI